MTRPAAADPPPAAVGPTTGVPAGAAQGVYAGRLAMSDSGDLLPLFLVIGTLFGALAAASAYAISYAEYRRRMLRPDQNPRRMALGMAAVTFAFFVGAAIALSFVLPFVMRRGPGT